MSGGYYPEYSICADQEIGAITASTTGTTINVTTGAYGAWTQISASTPADTTFVCLHGGFKSIPAFGCIFALAIGAAGSEVAIASGLAVAPFNGAGGTDSWGRSIFPLSIPAGTAISAAAKGTTGDVVKCKIDLFDGSIVGEGIAGYDETGAGSPTPSATANVKGNWAQIVASTVRDYAGILVGWDIHSPTFGVAYMFDIGIGAGGSEVVIINNILTVGREVANPGLWFPFDIPAGTKISVRCQSAATSGAAIDNIYISGGYR